MEILLFIIARTRNQVLKKKSHIKERRIMLNMACGSLKMIEGISL